MKTKIVKLIRAFAYKGITLRIVEREEPYMNSTMILTRVIAPNNGLIPISFHHRATQKSMINDTVTFLDKLSLMGCDVVDELSKEIEL